MAREHLEGLSAASRCLIAMATFLDLVNRVGRESGTISQSQELADVANANGRQAKIVGWTRQAWEMIQRERSDWTFRRKRFWLQLVPGQVEYRPAAFDAEWGGWILGGNAWSTLTIHDPAIGRGDENRLEIVPFERWLDTYDIGAPQEHRPNVAAFGYGDRALHVGPPPDKAYMVRGWCQRKVQSLTASDDIPYIHEDYHDAIIWRALMLLGDDDEAQWEVASSTAEYGVFRSQMVSAYTDPVVLT